MTDTQYVSLTRTNGISLVEMTRPDRRNALSVVMREQLIEMLSDAMDDSQSRVIVLTGSGGHFCAGGDLEDFELEDIEAGRERMRRAHVLPRLLAGGRKPVVAAVEGAAFGAGLSLALSLIHI